jgi:hypothetical protein
MYLIDASPIEEPADYHMVGNFFTRAGMVCYDLARSVDILRRPFGSFPEHIASAGDICGIFKTASYSGITWIVFERHIFVTYDNEPRPPWLIELSEL